MAAPHNQVFFPSTFQELFSAWKSFPHAVPYAGGTHLIRDQAKDTLDLPSIILCLDKLEELHRINRTERYLELGSMVKLNQIIQLGKIVPESLTRCLEDIAGIQVRNIATIGGNICLPGHSHDSSVPLTALEAQYELRSAQTSRWISASRFFSLTKTALEPRELLTRIRIPLQQWDYSAYRKFKSRTKKSGGAVVFLMKAQKNILTDIRVVYKTDIILRNKDSEALLAGEHLPLNHRAAGEFIENWKSFLSNHQEINELSKRKFMNFIELNIYNLSE